MTGKRSNHVSIDDPLSVDTADSDAERRAVIKTFREALPTRLVDARKSTICVIQQRLHTEDVIGFLRSEDHGYEFLTIPMEFDPARKCRTSIGWEDPRTEPGELMDPVRFPQEVVDRDRKLLGPYAAAAQFDQLPVPRDAGTFETELLRYIDEIPDEEIMWVRAWDLAGTEGGNGAYTAHVKIGVVLRSKRVIIAAADHDRRAPAGVRAWVQDLSETDGPGVEIVLPQDPGQAGKAQKSDLAGYTHGSKIFFEPQTGSKTLRAEPLASQVGAGNVDLLSGEWSKPLVEEMQMFPRGKTKDLVDAASSGYNRLSYLTRARKGPPSLALRGAHQANPVGVNDG